jgi:citrate lyase gamma subunit
MMGLYHFCFKARGAILSCTQQVAPMSDVKTRYDEDFFVWSKEQAEALRSVARDGSNQELDWENLAEEIEGVGISERRELRSQIERIILHLLKLQYSRATLPRDGWIDSVDDGRTRVELTLGSSPSLKGEVDEVVAKQMGRGVRKAIRELRERGELDAALDARIKATTYTAEEVLDENWYPPVPGT